MKVYINAPTTLRRMEHISDGMQFDGRGWFVEHDDPVYGGSTPREILKANGFSDDDSWSVNGCVKALDNPLPGDTAVLIYRMVKPQ